MSSTTGATQPQHRLQTFTARAVSRLNPTSIRNRQFPTKRRGLNPDDVGDFLSEIAAEIAALHRELVIVHQENDRLKRALRDWQTRQGTGLLRMRPHWPINQVTPEKAAG
ncbi:MAG TPA: DivIVA domain-containing protein [Micromonospora sp.]|nr:DivIVA domain-containing protein [Micromonospora sp.]